MTLTFIEAVASEQLNCHQQSVSDTKTCQQLESHSETCQLLVPDLETCQQLASDLSTCSQLVQDLRTTYQQLIPDLETYQQPIPDLRIYQQQLPYSQLTDCDVVYKSIVASFSSSDKKTEQEQNYKILLRFLRAAAVAVRCSDMDEELLCIIEQYLDVLTSDYTTQASDYGISRGKHFLLMVVSNWLGKEFQRLRPTIDRQVEKFKLDHIATINDLPGPDVLVYQLFPDFMVQLVLKWMDATQESDENDHNYEPATRWQHYQHDLYPFILLILEFTNTALVTGIAHVLYARLSCNT